MLSAHRFPKFVVPMGRGGWDGIFAPLERTWSVRLSARTESDAPGPDGSAPWTCPNKWGAK